MKKILVTGSYGLIGSEVCRFYLDRDIEVIGIDNNERKRLFGKDGDTSRIKNRLLNDEIMN